MSAGEGRARGTKGTEPRLVAGGAQPWREGNGRAPLRDPLLRLDGAASLSHRAEQLRGQGHRRRVERRCAASLAPRVTNLEIWTAPASTHRRPQGSRLIASWASGPRVVVAEARSSVSPSEPREGDRHSARRLESSRSSGLAPCSSRSAMPLVLGGPASRRRRVAAA